MLHCGIERMYNWQSDYLLLFIINRWINSAKADWEYKGFLAAITYMNQLPGINFSGAVKSKSAGMCIKSYKRQVKIHASLAI